jgi:hypothetical protein
MTQNQIAYWSLQENQRHNRAAEDETSRSNRAKETETNRANLAKEGLGEKQFTLDKHKSTSQEIRNWYSELVSKPVISAAESGAKFIGGLFK